MGSARLEENPLSPKMFGSDNRNPVYPFLVRENQSQYDSNSSTQLELFGHFPAGIDPSPANYTVTEQTPLRSPGKRCREGEDTVGRQNLQNSLNGIARVGAGADRPASIPNPNPVSTGLRLSYDDDEPNSSVTSASGSIPSLPMAMFLVDDLKNEIERQREEFNQCLRVQEEEIRKGMREMKQRHLTSFLGAVEKAVGRKLREKEVQIESMNRRNKELNERIKQVSMEAQSWHYRARFNESLVSVLKNNLNQAIAQGTSQGREGCGDSEVDDAASSYGPSSPLGGAAVLPPAAMACRACRSREISVLLLPCRHLCLCKICGGSVNVCPVCRSAKTASVPVFMS